MNQIITQRIAALRASMAAAGIDLFIQPNADPHLSEYLPEHWKCLAWVSGFTGEAATLVVTPREARLWTDSRFFVQATEQLDGTGIELMRGGLPDTPTVAQYIARQHPACIGFDGRLMSVLDAEQMIAPACAADAHCRTIDDFHPFDTLWTDRPASPQGALELYSEELAGEETLPRLQRVVDAIARQHATHLLLTRLDDIAWAFNVRGTDIHCTPVCTAFALISAHELRLFVAPGKVSPEVRSALSGYGITVADYTHIGNALAQLQPTDKLIANRADLTVALQHPIEQSGVEWLPAGNPIPLMRALKNDTEQAGYRNAMVKDGVALVRFYRHLEAALAAGKTVTELDCVQCLIDFRSREALYREESFDAIVAWGAHAAMPHYYPNERSNVAISGDGLLLIDTGGQYLDGTTDITRTIAIGTPTHEMCADFTRVMKGHIRFAQACFPQGTRGDQLDALARIDLWQAGKTYRHGTSHGVGHYLGVHEGPESVRMEHNPQVLLEGMVLSNEPAIYLEGEYGIRHENCVAVQPFMTTADGAFYRFETLTLYPFDTTVLLTDWLTDDERAWLNDYHHTVYDQLAPHLTPEEADWLRQKTAEI
jgi:Xaa-Pro aminopeptidase